MLKTTGKPEVPPSLFVASAAVGLVLRLLLCQFKSNFDYESYVLVTDLMKAGKNVYNSTDRYNYGPVWMWVLFALRSIAPAYFRLSIAIFLSFIDLAIAGLLYRRGNRVGAILYLFCPVSIVITGYHGQFDNLALLIGLIAITFLERRDDYKQFGMKGITLSSVVVFSIIIGLSIATKHILIFFPIWFLFQSGMKGVHKIIILLVPALVFIASFLPYLSAAEGIMNHVFLYQPYPNTIFYHLFFPQVINDMIAFGDHNKQVFVVLICLWGYFLRKRTPSDLFALYCLFIVMFASTLFTHYLIIAAFSLAWFRSRFWKWYSAVGLFFFLFQGDQFNIKPYLSGDCVWWGKFIDDNGYYAMVFILFLAVVDLSNPQFWNRFSLKRILSKTI